MDEETRRLMDRMSAQQLAMMPQLDAFRKGREAGLREAAVIAQNEIDAGKYDSDVSSARNILDYLTRLIDAGTQKSPAPAQPGTGPGHKTED